MFAMYTRINLSLIKEKKQYVTLCPVFGTLGPGDILSVQLCHHVINNAGY